VSTHGEHAQVRVSNLELFFDLVFVFTITQLTALVEHHLSLLGVVRAALVFVVLYWMYSGYAWLTNQVPPTTSSRRLLLVCGMASFLICALAIPRAFERTALAFSLGYVLVVLVHSGLYAQVHGAGVWRFVPLNLLGAACLVGAAFASGWARYSLWVTTVVLHYATTRLSERVSESQSTGFAIRADAGARDRSGCWYSALSAWHCDLQVRLWHPARCHPAGSGGRGRRDGARWRGRVRPRSGGTPDRDSDRVARVGVGRRWRCTPVSVLSA